MKIEVSIEIAAELSKVYETFNDPKLVHNWHTSMISFESISGTPGTEGAVNKLIIQAGKKEMKMTERVEKVIPNSLLAGSYEWDGGSNTMENHFEALTDDRTKLTSVVVYAFSSFGMKVMGALFPGIFRRQIKEVLDRFASYVEAQ